jgi:hypothetical protein
MAKTLQGELDEKAEREEAEAHEMMEDIDVTGEGGAFEHEDEGGEAHTADEQDLDANIPDGDIISDLDDDIPEADSFVDGTADEDEDEAGEVDMDDDIPEAETDTIWDSFDEGEEENGYASAPPESPTIASSTREGSEGYGGVDGSPQQAIFSHDEAYPDERSRHTRPGYDWRGRPRYRRNVDDGMDMDSDD